jgi:hypothetical protein
MSRAREKGNKLMGMDVVGKKPSAPAGEYFRNNVWWWHPLWTFCEDNFPEIASKVTYAHTNDGDGLNSRDSKRLSNGIRAMIADGSAQQYIDERNQRLASLARSECDLCNGTGIRTDSVGVENGMPTAKLNEADAILLGRTEGTCNGCRGEGKCDSWETNYRLDLDNITNFADFLQVCGGFEIC